jgi:hypothetical protein
MGFNKKIISEESIKKIANRNDYEFFFKYFNSNAILCEDMFSLNIFNRIKMCSIDNTDEIISIMNDCKKN